MNCALTKSVSLKAQQDVVQARQVGRDIAKELDFGAADQTRLATAISEIARNALVHGGSGAFKIAGKRDERTTQVQVSVLDHGPGIADIDAAMRDSFSSGGGLGMGLPGTRRLVDHMEIDSSPGLTVVSFSMVRRNG